MLTNSSPCSAAHLLLGEGFLGETDALLPTLREQQVQPRRGRRRLGRRQQPHHRHRVDQHLRFDASASHSCAHASKLADYAQRIMKAHG